MWRSTALGEWSVRSDDQTYDRVHDPAGDKEQDCPYHIVDLPPEIGGSLLHHLRSPEEDGSQEEDDRDHRYKDRD